MGTSRHFRAVHAGFVVALLLLVVGCGDETTRLAGTIDLPKKERSRPETKSVAKTKVNPRSGKP